MKWNRRTSLALAAAAVLAGTGFAVTASGAESTGAPRPASSPTSGPVGALDDNGSGGHGADDVVLGGANTVTGDSDDHGMDDAATHDVGDDHGLDDAATHDVGDDHGGARIAGVSDDSATHDAGDDHGSASSGSADSGRHDSGDDHASGGHGSDD